MNSYIGDIVFIGVVIYVCAWWFISSKNKTIKKYVVIVGILYIIVVVTYNARKLLDLPASAFLALLGLGSLIGALVFSVKAILLKRRLKRRLDKSSE